MACNSNLLNATFKHLNVCGGLDMHNSGITNVNSINGMTPGNFTTNIVNVIYKQGALTVSNSNVYGSWSSIVALASQMNVNQILNIYFDDSLSSPCIIDQSYNFKSRCSFFSALTSTTPVTVKIINGVIISNIRGIYRTVNLVCDSITGPNLAFDNGSAFELQEGSSVDNTATSLVPSILLNNQNLSIIFYLTAFVVNNGNPSVSTLRLTNNSAVIILNNFEPVPSAVMNNAISDDGTGNLSIISDASWASFPTFSGFTGTYNKQTIDHSSLVSYDDSKSTSFGTDNVQGALDSLKTSVTTGALTTTNTSNQITLGNTNTTTINSVVPASSLTYTITDQSSSCNVSLGINKWTTLVPPITLTPPESGNVYEVNTNSSAVVTLPVVTNGVKFTFVVTAPINTSYVITCQSQVLYGSLLSSDGTAVVSGAINSPCTSINIGPTAVIGDKYEFMCNSANWFVYGITADHTSVIPV